MAESIAFVHGTGPLGGTGTEGCAATDGRGVSSGRIRSVVVPGADDGACEEGACEDGAAAAENGPGRAEGVALDGGAPVGADDDGGPAGVDLAGAVEARPGVELLGAVPPCSGPTVAGSESRAPSVADVPLVLGAEPPPDPSTGRGVVAAPPVDVRFAAGTGVPTGAPAVASTRPTSTTAKAIATHRRRQ